MSHEIKILSIKEISSKLKDRKLYIVADATGLTFPTLKKLANGVSSNYNYKTLYAISKYFDNECK